MRKILLSLVMVILIVIMAVTMKNGLNVGSFKLPGFQEIEKENDELTEIIADANEKKVEYQGSLDLLESDASAMAKAKKEYLDLVQVSTDSDIKEALQTKTYTIEYLWSKVGNYAAKEGLNIRMDLTSSTVGAQDYRNLSFTLDGKYLQIINFISDIENDADLDFTIDNFSMTKDNAKFTVKDIKLESGTTSGATVGTSYTVDNTTSGTSPDTTSTGTSSTSTTSTSTTSPDYVQGNSTPDNTTTN